MTLLLDYFALLIVSALMFILRVLPLRASTFVARGVVSIILLVMPRLKGVGRRNLELCFPEKGTKERDEILRRSFWCLAKNLATFAKIPDLNREAAEKLIDFSGGKEQLRKLKERTPELGIIQTTLHYGCFEMGVQLQALLAYNLSYIARGFGLERLDRWWNTRREMFSNTVITRDGGYRELMKRISSGETVGLLIDQNVKSNHAVFVDFFGIPAATTKTVAIAALRTGASIYFSVMAEIEKPEKNQLPYVLYSKEIYNPHQDPGSVEEKISQITKELHEISEEVIRKHPEQWFWIHRRFKTRPPGESESIYE